MTGDRNCEITRRVRHHVRSHTVGHLCVACVVVALAVSQAVPQPNMELATFVRRYVASGDDSVLYEFLAWPPGRIEQMSRDYPTLGPWHDFGLVLLHSEASSRADIGRASEVHAQAIERLIRQRVWPVANGNGDRALNVALQRWLSTLLVAAPGRRWDLRNVADSGPVQLAWGTRDEYFMGPVASGTSTRGYTLDEGPPYVTTPHGRFSAALAEKAIAAFEEALRLDASLLEARVRLGWVQGRVGRTDIALAHLAQVIAEADSTTTRYAYLAHLFRGRLMTRHRDAAYQQRAAAEYEAAMRLEPRWPVARLELTRLALLYSAMPPTAVGPIEVDPWATYPRGAGWWERFDRMRELRPVVASGMNTERQQP